VHAKRVFSDPTVIALGSDPMRAASQIGTAEGKGHSDMGSPAGVRKRLQRFFAWMFLLASISLFSLVGLELLFPPPPLAPPPERSLLDLLEFDLPDPQLLAVVIALVADLASFACLIVTTLLDWLDHRHRHRHSV
jgi:hypothetical protein